MIPRPAPSAAPPDRARQALMIAAGAQAVVSVCLLVVAIIVHSDDETLSDLIVASIIGFWFGHGTALAQFAALSAARTANTATEVVAHMAEQMHEGETP